MAPPSPAGCMRGGGGCRGTARTDRTAAAVRPAARCRGSTRRAESPWGGVSALRCRAPGPWGTVGPWSLSLLMAPCYDGPLQKATPERRIPMDLPFSHCLVYVTAADEAEAQAIGRAMGAARLEIGRAAWRERVCTYV